MPNTDAQGLALSGATDQSLAQLNVALHQPRCYIGDPVATVDAALAHSPDLVMGHVLRPIRHRSHRFGGSHAQRDLLDLTLLESAIRSGEPSLAQAFAAERLALKPHSLLARLCVERAALPRVA